MGKAGDKADFKDRFRRRLDKYSLSEKETPTRKKVMEVMMEKLRKWKEGSRQ